MADHSKESTDLPSFQLKDLTLCELNTARDCNQAEREIWQLAVTISTGGSLSLEKQQRLVRQAYTAIGGLEHMLRHQEWVQLPPEERQHAEQEFMDYLFSRRPNPYLAET